MRVTENMMARSFLAHSNAALARTARLQEMIASGRKFLKPSDDPSGIAKALDLRSDLRSVEAFRDNASSAGMIMSVTESSLSEVSDLLSRAKELVVAAINATTDQGAAAAHALELSQMIETALLVANTDVGGRSVFAGTSTLVRPYAETGGAVRYQGDSGELVEELGPGLRVVLNLTGPQAFQTVPARIEGAVDLDPAASTITPLSDLLGGAGVTTGIVRITDSDGTSAEIDLLAAKNLGEVIDAINGSGVAVSASLTPDGRSLVLADGGSGSKLLVEDLSGGELAAGLGIAGETDTGTITGVDLNPALTEGTPMALLLQGAGIPPGTWTIRNDGEGILRSGTIDPSQANTVGDLLDLLESATTAGGAKLGIRASLDKTGVILESTILHTALSVSDEAGGTSARAVGVAGGAVAKDVFALLRDAASAIESRDTEAMDRMLREITTAVERTADVRGTYGARSRQVLNLAQSLDSQKVDVTIRLSDVEDVDLALAAVELAQSDTVYSASLAAGARMFELNLFSFIR
jgi:flagellin-like hook-associated protein FlgL